MNELNGFCKLNPTVILKAREEYGTPIYLYDENSIIEKCKAALSMPNAYGIAVRYAMKANSTRAILEIVNEQGLLIDASSLNEAKRANMAGIRLDHIFL